VRRKFLSVTQGDPAKPAVAKLQFLDFVEEIAREHGQPVPTALLEHLRGLIREGGPLRIPTVTGPLTSQSCA
jgi:hypothetical protein